LGEVGGERQACFSRATVRLSQNPLNEMKPGVKEYEGIGTVPETVRIKFWGVRGSIPTPGPPTVFFGGNTTCVELRVGGELIVLDAGSGMRPLGSALAKEFGETPIHMTLLITHTHWDHIQGFPFFLPAYQAQNQVRILGYEGARDGLRGTLAGQMESSYFPVALHEMPGNLVIEELKEPEFRIGKLAVTACRANHPGMCVGYRVETAAGAVVFLPDNESYGRHPSGIPIAGEVREFIRGAEVLIADTQYTAEEYQMRRGWGHGCLDEVVREALRADVKRLYLFHHDPSHDDRFVSGMLGYARELVAFDGGRMEVEAAREGGEILLRSRQLAVA
jgi:phosphoribosyl 1,2-cyclic phosphodiesterase